MVYWRRFIAWVDRDVQRNFWKSNRGWAGSLWAAPFVPVALWLWFGDATMPGYRLAVVIAGILSFALLGLVMMRMYRVAKLERQKIERRKLARDRRKRK